MNYLQQFHFLTSRIAHYIFSFTEKQGLIKLRTLKERKNSLQLQQNKIHINRCSKQKCLRNKRYFLRIIKIFNTSKHDSFWVNTIINVSYFIYYIFNAVTHQYYCTIQE